MILTASRTTETHGYAIAQPRHMTVAQRTKRLRRFHICRCDCAEVNSPSQRTYTTSRFLEPPPNTIFPVKCPISLTCSPSHVLAPGGRRYTQERQLTVHCLSSHERGGALTSRAVIFLGINDCGTADLTDDLEAVVGAVFDAVHNLYIKAKARHFVLIDVPPIDRSPQGMLPLRAFPSYPHLSLSNRP